MCACVRVCVRMCGGVRVCVCEYRVLRIIIVNCAIIECVVKPLLLASYDGILIITYLLFVPRLSKL